MIILNTSHANVHSVSFNQENFNCQLTFSHQVTTTLRKIYDKTGFYCPEFSSTSIRTESTILNLYGRIRVSENPYSCIFYAVENTFQGFSMVTNLIQFS